MNKQIYLDYNATVPLLTEVKKSIIDCMHLGPLNASSVHYFGRKGKDVIDVAKTNLGELINTNKNKLFVFINVFFILIKTFIILRSKNEKKNVST